MNQKQKTFKNFNNFIIKYGEGDNLNLSHICFCLDDVLSETGCHSKGMLSKKTLAIFMDAMYQFICQSSEKPEVVNNFAQKIEEMIKNQENGVIALAALNFLIKIAKSNECSPKVVEKAKFSLKALPAMLGRRF